MTHMDTVADDRHWHSSYMPSTTSPTTLQNHLQVRRHGDPSSPTVWSIAAAGLVAFWSTAAVLVLW